MGAYRCSVSHGQVPQAPLGRPYAAPPTSDARRLSPDFPKGCAMLESMEQLIRDLELIPSGSVVLCAVSGGADSVCLLHALYHLRPRLGFQLAAAHYNHQLRGEESDRDADFVAQFVSLCCGAQRLPDGVLLPPVPLFSGSGDVGSQAKRLGTGVEETARRMRYAFLRHAARESGARLIATAHTADDNGETLLLHLARGSGLRGLTGIPPRRDSLIRPLLTTTRSEVEAYLSYYGLPHREDRTNLDDTYARNRIRHQVSPVLEELYPGFAARTAATAALLREDEAYLSAQAAQISGQAVPSGDSLSIPAALIGEAPPPLAARAVRQLVGRLNGGDQDCSAAHLRSVVRLCREPDPSGEVHLPHGLSARREYQSLLLTRGEEPQVPADTPMALPGETTAGSWLLSCAPSVYGGQPQGPFDFWLSCRLAPSLTLRPRRTGDRLRLPGRVEKTVKKWLIDEKIPRLRRDCLPVLDCGGRTAAVTGLGPDESFLPDPGQPAWHITAVPLAPAGAGTVPTGTPPPPG